MDNIPEKFPSIYNHPLYKEINLKLYNEIPYRAIAKWLKETTDCEEDCISQSWIGEYARYVKKRGGFGQLLPSEDIDYDDVTLSDLDQHALNLLYQRLPDLEGGNFVQACATIFKHSRPTNVNLDVDANVNADIEHGFTKYTTDDVKDFLKKLRSDSN